jgi:TonB-linked outer membrane protein, SusC/RagA family
MIFIPSVKGTSWPLAIRIFIIMKLVAFLILGLVLQTSADVKAQHITLNVQSKTLREVMKQIQLQQGYSFFFRGDRIAQTRVSVQVERANLAQAMAAILADEPLEWALKDGTIIIKPKAAGHQTAAPPPAEVQQREITGRVVDAQGAPLAGVTVSVKGSNSVTTTDAQGSFRLMLPPGSQTLVFSNVGFEPQEATVSNQRSVQVTLAGSVSDLDEVVVVGYGTQRKANLSGAVEMVDGKRLADRPIGNVSQALQGISPGLNVFTNNSGGQPDATMNFNIRGMGNPLVLVDGLPVDINLVNPEDIENISVIKDASSAAIYGANAPYGVILITTKKGQFSEGKPRFNYNNTLSMGAPTRLPHPVNSLDFSTYLNAATVNAGSAPLFSDEVIARIKQYMQDPSSIPAVGPDPLDPSKWAKRENANGNTNWYEELLKPWALRQKHDLSMNGGGQHFNYYVSLGLFDHRGQMRHANEGYKRYNIDAKMSATITDWMRLNFLTKFSNSDIDYPNDGYGLDRSVMWHDFPRRFPTDPVRYPNGTWSEMSRFQVFEDGGREKHVTNDFWTKIEVEFEPIKGWLIKGDYGWNNKASTSSLHRAKVDAVGPDGTLYTHFDTTPLNSLTKTFARNNYWNANIYSSYETHVSDHNFKLLVGHQREFGKFEDLSGYRDNLLTDYVPAILLATGSTRLFDHMNEWSTMGTFARLNYDYRGKYLLEFNGRYQGSSRFDEASRFGFFPSLSVAYRLSEENYWAPLKNTLNEFKLRASYGSLGNHNVANFLYLPVMPVKPQVSWVAGNTPVIGINAPGIVSSSLTWETISTTNVGFDAGLMNNRILVTFDLFKREISDMIGTPNPLPATLGTSVPQENNAAQKNTGWELSITYKGTIQEDFQYELTAGLTDYKTVITRWNNPNRVLSQNYEGRVLGEIWGYRSNGLFQSDEEIASAPSQSRFFGVWKPGDVRYEDVDGNGEIGPGLNTVDNPGDLRIIGNSNPRYLYSLNLGMRYKRFDFNMFWTGVGKRDVDFSGGGDWVFWGHADNVWGTSVFEQHMDYYRADNPGAYWPNPYISAETHKNRQTSTRYLQNAAYARLKNLSLGYTLPQRLTNRLSLSNTRIFFNAENLLTFSGIERFLDPEGTDGNFGRGKVYPIQKTLSLGLNINF